MREVGPLAARGAEVSSRAQPRRRRRSSVDAHAGPDGRRALVQPVGQSVTICGAAAAGWSEARRRLGARFPHVATTSRTAAGHVCDAAMRARRSCGRSTRWRWPRDTPPTPVDATPEPCDSGCGSQEAVQESTGHRQRRQQHLPGLLGRLPAAVWTFGERMAIDVAGFRRERAIGVAQMLSSADSVTAIPAHSPRPS